MESNKLLEMAKKRFQDRREFEKRRKEIIDFERKIIREVFK